MRLGVHVSIAGSIYEALDRAKALGCNTMQIFSRNPRLWKAKPITTHDIIEFRTRRKKTGIYPVVVHMPYLINLASPQESLYRRSIESYIEDIRQADLLGAEYLVTHMGSHRGKGEVRGLNRLASALNKIEKTAKPRLTILLEITAGSGDWLGYKFEHVRIVLNKLRHKEKFGVCFDTAHAFEAGYDIRTNAGLSRTIKEFDRIIGLKYLKIIHLNDSKTVFGSGSDRHWHIGKGKIGIEALKRIVNHPRLKRLPFILETPKKTEKDDRMNLLKVKRIYRG